MALRVTSAAGNDDGTFTITGLQQEPNNYRYINDGVRLEPAPITVTRISVLEAPANIKISEVGFVEQGLSVSSKQVSRARWLTSALLTIWFGQSM
ncbi:hypothetical protein [Pantoea vagans]|uniref:hypothetical protein n=1 Tax=Pantoea vagans TaxID=470934 RepID=UPI003FA36A03